MALDRGSVPIPFSWTVRDNNRKLATSGVLLPPALAGLGVDNWAAGTRAAFLALTNAQLVGASSTLNWTEDAPVAAPPESEVERKLVMVFQSNVRGDFARIEIPSPVFSIETANTDNVDVTNPLVAAFAEAIIDGGVGFENGAVTIRGNQITQIVRAYISHRYRKPSV